MGVQPSAGALATKYLLGLACLIVGLAFLITGFYSGSAGLVVLGGAAAALGALLVILKVVTRNRPPD